MKMTTKQIFTTLDYILSELKNGFNSVPETQLQLLGLQSQAKNIGLDLTIPSNEELKLMHNIQYESSDPDWEESSY
jgi:hypothetical protein